VSWLSGWLLEMSLTAVGADAELAVEQIAGIMTATEEEL
jgi:hypothetical protein